MLLERDAPLEALLAGARRAAAGHGSIVLLEGDEKLAPADREAADRVARAIYYETRDRAAKLDERLAGLPDAPAPSRHPRGSA